MCPGCGAPGQDAGKNRRKDLRAKVAMCPRAAAARSVIAPRVPEVISAYVASAALVV